MIDNFENEMVAVIAKYHRHPIKEIEDSYDRTKQFDKVITLINYADEYNRSLEYMTHLFLRLIQIRRGAFEWINWAGQNGRLKDTIEETLRER